MGDRPFLGAPILQWSLMTTSKKSTVTLWRLSNQPCLSARAGTGLMATCRTLPRRPKKAKGYGYAKANGSKSKVLERNEEPAGAEPEGASGQPLVCRNFVPDDQGGENGGSRRLACRDPRARGAAQHHQRTVERKEYALAQQLSGQMDAKNAGLPQAARTPAAPEPLARTKPTRAAAAVTNAVLDAAVIIGWPPPTS